MLLACNPKETKKKVMAKGEQLFSANLVFFTSMTNDFILLLVMCFIIGNYGSLLIVNVLFHIGDLFLKVVVDQFVTNYNLTSKVLLIDSMPIVNFAFH